MNLRLCVVIPVFDNPQTIRDAVERTLQSCLFPILIVDDGSEKPVSGLLPNNQRIHNLRLNKNEGKGFALQRAIAWCLSRGFTHMISLDGDGQHFPEDILLLAEEVRKNPWNLVIGERKMDATAPSLSHFGKRFSNFWVRYQASTEVRDSQSGFRAYPLFSLQTLRFFTRSYDFEIEVLVRLLWRGTEVSHVPVRVLYQPPGERVSHFGKFRDNLRISVLNIFLVALSLCKQHREPLPAALAMGLGVLVGCTPLFGLHTLIVIVLAIFFRLNALLLWLGTQISIPPLAPVLAFISLLLGSWLLQKPLEPPTMETILPFARDSFITWLAGSLLLGTLLGIASGLATYAVVRRIRKKKAVANWSGESRGGQFGNAFLIGVLRRFGLRAGYFCLSFVVPYFYLFAPKARRSLQEYWAIREPSISWLQRHKKSYLHLRSFARVLMDKLYGNHINTKDAFLQLSTGFENVRSAHAKGRGVLLIGAHTGSSDLAAASMRSHKLNTQFHTLRHEAQRDHLNEMAGELSKDIVNIIYSSESNPAIYQVHQLLKRGEILGLMADRPIDHKFELVPFLGKLAPIATSPFRIALATGADIIFTCSFKEGLSAYQSSATKPTPPLPNLNRELATFHYAQEYARWIEAKLDRYPDQWFNLYPFFSSAPTLPGGERCLAKRCFFVEELAAAKTIRF